jgi:hypothetical protein
MQAVDDIGDPLPQDPSCDLLTRRSELHHAEFVERVPELQRQNAVSVRRQYGRFAPYWATSNTFAEFLDWPTHPAVGRYRTALMFAPDDTPRPQTFEAARAHYEKYAVDFYHRCDFRLQRDIVKWSDGGEYVSLCAIIDVAQAMVNARRALEERTDAPPSRQKFCVIDGEVFPVSQTPPRRARTRKAKS